MEICFRSEISGCKIVLKVKSLCATEGRRVDVEDHRDEEVVPGLLTRDSAVVKAMADPV